MQAIIQNYFITQITGSEALKKRQEVKKLVTLFPVQKLYEVAALNETLGDL